MPFTLAHPAAALPLARRLGRLGVPSALFIGSLTPDAGYFLPGLGARSESHSLEGLLLPCLPVGLAAWAVFHLLLAHPLVALLPGPIAGRIAPRLGPPWRLPRVSPLGVVVSILLGAATHLAWDAFTHPGAPAVQALPPLRTLLFVSWGYPVRVHTVLQHASTVIGLLLLAGWSVRWLVRQPSPRGPGPAATLRLFPRDRRRAWLLLTLVPLAAGLVSALASLPSHWTAYGVQVLVARFVVDAMTTFGLVVLAFAVGLRLRARSGHPV